MIFSCIIRPRIFINIPRTQKKKIQRNTRSPLDIVCEIIVSSFQECLVEEDLLWLKADLTCSVRLSLVIFVKWLQNCVMSAVPAWKKQERYAILPFKICIPGISPSPVCIANVIMICCRLANAENSDYSWTLLSQRTTTVSYKLEMRI